ncbi:MAG TPA: hypothetical protein VFX46_03055 [Hyphomicrobiaceae bacterium]|nr:hypothetical protein [Hyphomicrobiaceae bacterium]
MTRARWAIVIGVTALLVALLVWQQERQREVQRCIDSGGIWDGPTSRCVPDPARPILQRDLQRT